MNNAPCPVCSGMVPIPFPYDCPLCHATFDGILGKGTSSFQVKNNFEHRDLIRGREIKLYNRWECNASFDFYGDAMLTDLVRFTVSYGHRATVPSDRGNKQTNVIVSYIPQIIGSGAYADNMACLLPCSGLLLSSPASVNYSHSFPLLDDYVRARIRRYRGILHPMRPSHRLRPRSLCRLLRHSWQQLAESSLSVAGTNPYQTSCRATCPPNHLFLG